jgi:small subunit ribosomal protein S21
MVEVHLDESDRLDWALKAFRRKVQKAGIMQDLRRRKHYVKPSEARQRKAKASQRRQRSPRASRG